MNYATLKGRMIAFNYRSIYDTEEERLKMHKTQAFDHYLKQFNEETIKTKSQCTCGEPCSAVCKKLRGEYKKDYEPYQTMGPLIGVFDQRAAELINGKADAAGFDGISAGGVLAWLMDCLDTGLLSQEDLGVTKLPRWNLDAFDVVADSMHNAELAMELVDSILQKRGLVDMLEGVRKWARKVKRDRGVRIIDTFVHTAYGRKGWMVPNQYWTPGALAPMAIMGKYYMFYGSEFYPPRLLGRICADRLKAELVIDNLGVCRFHRGWAEDMLPEIVESLYGMREQFLEMVEITASRINSRNSSIFWESERDIDFVMTFLKRRRGRGRGQGPQAPDVDRRLREGQAGGRARLVVRDEEGHRRDAPRVPLTALLDFPALRLHASASGSQGRFFNGGGAAFCGIVPAVFTR